MLLLQVVYRHGLRAALLAGLSIRGPQWQKLVVSLVMSRVSPAFLSTGGGRGFLRQFLLVPSCVRLEDEVKQVKCFLHFSMWSSSIFKLHGVAAAS